MSEMTLADHAEAWWIEQGHYFLPLRDTSAWEAMYNEWVR